MTILLQRSRSSNLELQRKYAYRQMRKMVYPHQLRLIENGKQLEETMPTSQKQACVIAFDIVRSSGINHVMAKDFLRNVFRRCYETMMSDYDEVGIRAHAYRIKEMGDGFLCSIGFPFDNFEQNIAIEGLRLAEKFVAILNEEAVILESDQPPKCGIGIAIGNVSRFYPVSGTMEYDLFGEGIILATRY